MRQQVQAKSKLRKISLRRLEHAIEQRLENGQPPDDEMLHLAGLQRAEFVFIYPDQNDIIIAGPAEVWVEDLSGRAVGISTGQPVILLEDLITGLRTFAPGRNVKTWVACSIDPTADGIQRLREFQRQMPSRVPDQQRGDIADYAAQGLRESLGLASIRVHGISRRTHAAQVMIEADYRMKLIAVGLEPPPIRMATFIDEIAKPPRGMQRWWLVPDYKCIKQSDDRLALQLMGRGVQLNTENIDFGSQGQIVQQKTKVSNAARKYAEAFTTHYPQIAQARPVFAQLRNVIDLLVISAWLMQNDGYATSGWQPSIFLDNQQLPVDQLPDVKQAQCVANAVWKGRVLILPAGGGVLIQASNALARENLIADKDGILNVARQQSVFPNDDRWWWD